MPSAIIIASLSQQRHWYWVWFRLSGNRTYWSLFQLAIITFVNITHILIDSLFRKQNTSVPIMVHPWLLASGWIYIERILVLVQITSQIIGTLKPIRCGALCSARANDKISASLIAQNNGCFLVRFWNLFLPKWMDSLTYFPLLSYWLWNNILAIMVVFWYKRDSRLSAVQIDLHHVSLTFPMH